jgi:hypothetical protein
MENSETEKTEQKERNILSSIEIPWKEFLNPTLLFLLVWIGSLLYMFIWAPPNDENNLGFGDIDIAYGKTNPAEWSIFMLVGVWALLYTVLLLIENRERFVPSWLFVLASFGLGMYVMMPYFALRKVKKKKSKTKKTLFIKIIDSRILGIILSELGRAIALYGIIAASILGKWGVFADSFLNVRLIQLSTVDFALLTLFYPIVIWSDMKRRGWKNLKLFILFCIPLLGSFLYLTIKPPLPEE